MRNTRLTLSTECEVGHEELKWGCKSCDKKLKQRVEYWKMLDGLKK